MPSYPGKVESVHLSSFPEVRREYLDESLNDRWERIWEIRAVVTKALEEARKEKGIGLSLDAQVQLFLPEKAYALLQSYEKELKSIFIVSSVTLTPDPAGKEVRAEVTRAAGGKCERCWNYDTSVGQQPEHPFLCKRCTDAIQRPKSV
jgi:isoleucyl-tRNA synthetase